MKKSVIVCSLVLLFAVSFISAFSFSDLFGKITGEVVVEEDEVIIQESMNTSVSVSVYEGWNLIHYFPILDKNNFEIGSTISFNNIKGAYQLLPFLKDYVQIMNESSDSLINIGDTQGESALVQFIRGGTEAVKLKFDTQIGFSKGKNSHKAIKNVAWVYFDKSGILKYTYSPPGSTNMLSSIHLFEGWNFVGIIPLMFGTDDFFTLNEIKGTCNILQAHFFEGVNGQWINIGLDDVLDKSYMGRGISIEVSGDCVLGKIVSDYTCIEDDGGDNSIKKGEVKIVDKDGQIIQSEVDECVISDLGGFELRENYCGFTEFGEIFIGEVFYQGCINCVEGACLDKVPKSIECFDIEGTIGMGTGLSGGYTLLKKDLSFIQDSCYMDDEEVDSCSGAGCSLKEYVCNGDLREFKIVDCSTKTSCSKGVCFA